MFSKKTETVDLDKLMHLEDAVFTLYKTAQETAFKKEGLSGLTNFGTAAAAASSVAAHDCIQASDGPHSGLDIRQYVALYVAGWLTRLLTNLETGTVHQAAANAEEKLY